MKRNLGSVTIALCIKNACEVATMHTYDIRRGFSLLAVLAMAFFAAGCEEAPWHANQPV